MVISYSIKKFFMLHVMTENFDKFFRKFDFKNDRSEFLDPSPDVIFYLTGY